MDMDRMKLLEEFFTETEKIMKKYWEDQFQEVQWTRGANSQFNLQRLDAEPTEEEWDEEMLAFVKTKFHELYLDTLRTREELERLPI